MLYFHYPKKLVVNGRTIFANMRFIHNQILLTCAVYLYNPINFQEIKYFVDGEERPIRLIERRAYEPSGMCILEDENWKDKPFTELRIVYQNESYEYVLQKEEYPTYKFVATTLFKDDYELMDLYVDYYSKLGVECFFFYYNGKIDETMFDFMRDTEIPIHITEWDYTYWLKSENPYQIYPDHHAQVIEVADALYWSKHTCTYCLFNDFDEYLILDGSLESLVQKYPQATCFSFECFWGTIGDDVVSHKEAKSKFYELPLRINERGCGNTRRKCMIQSENIDIMRIHLPDSGKRVNTIYFGGFYHLCNFDKLDRRIYMESNLIQSEQYRLSTKDITLDAWMKQVPSVHSRYICANASQVPFIRGFVEKEILCREKCDIEGFELKGSHHTFNEYFLYQKKTITRVGFEYFWSSFFLPAERIYLIHLLSLVPNGVLEMNLDRCDIIYHSYFGNPFSEKSSDKKYIFFSGEKYNIPTEQYSLSICQKEDSERVVCYPFFFTVLHSYAPRYDMVMKENHDTTIPPEFCAFIVGNPACQLRILFFQYLSQKYKKVNSYGKVLNNMGFVPDFPYNDARQLQLLSKHKFVICFENTKTEDYYITEKLLIAKAAGCIPIYWGSSKCLELFDKNAFLYLEEDSIQGIEKLISKIKLIDTNPKLFFEIRKRPLLTKETIERFSKDILLKKIHSYL